MGDELPTIFAGQADALQALPEQHNRRVFHYTSAEALSGIFEARLLYASHIATLNDSSERFYGWDLIRGRWVHDRVPVSPAANRLIERALSDKYQRSAPNTYVVSASERRNDLSQYRAYGHYVLGLAAGAWRAVERGTYGRPVTAVWRKVLYGPRVPIPYIDRMFMTIDRAVEEGALSDARMTARWLDHLAVHCKHEAFRSEQEVRLVFASTAEAVMVRTRPVSGVIRPYLEVECESGAAGMVEEIVLGPRAGGELARLGVEYLLNTQLGVSHGVTIDESNMPYR